MVKYRTVPAADWAEIVRQCNLAPAQAELFSRTIEDVVREINAFDRIPLAERQEHRRRKLEALRVTAETLRRLADRLSLLDANQVEALDNLLSEDLGRLLSTTAIWQLLGVAVDSSFSTHDLESRDFTGRGGPAPAIEARMIARRQWVMRGRAREALVSFASRLEARLSEDLDIEAQNRGGAPGRLYRRFAVKHLIRTYKECFHELPVSTPEGRFMTLCELVLESIGIDTTGLEPAVARELAAIRSAGDAS